VALAPYEHAAWRPELERLHANEAPWRQPGDTSIAGLNRYPRAAAGRTYRTTRRALLTSHPSASLSRAEVTKRLILLVRAFCRAGEDAVLVCPPTFACMSSPPRFREQQLANVPLRPESGFDLD